MSTHRRPTKGPFGERPTKRRSCEDSRTSKVIKRLLGLRRLPAHARSHARSRDETRPPLSAPQDCADIFTTVIPVSPAPILCATAEIPSPRTCLGRCQTSMQMLLSRGELAPCTRVGRLPAHLAAGGPRSSDSQTSANPGLVASKASRVFATGPSVSRTRLAKQSGMTLLALTLPCGEINYQYGLAFGRHSKCTHWL